MKKLAIALLAVSMLALTTTASADRYQRATGDNPARIVGYVLHPVGIALEYAIMRPIHWVVSQPDMDVLFGHDPNVREDDTYFEWKHGDFSPSIAEERGRMPSKETK